MAYQVLARKYRPQLFSDVIGQDHVTRTLLNALAQNRIAHGYIFSGHRGIGKTTIARILASALNCRTKIGTELRPTPEPCNACESCIEIRQGNAVDVIEIDAATNRGIEDVRELRDAARYKPSRDKYKIIILDEAHQITDAAFNALLKTLEEPPDHIVFMFATTQPEDIPQTIRSRCQHFSFHAVKLDDIVGQLQMISKKEAIVTDDATLSLLAEAGDGSMRDALSIMDQAIASAPTVDGHPALEITQVRELMGSVSNVVYEQILEAVHANNSADVLAVVGRLLDAGNGAPQLARQFVRYLRNTIVAKITKLAPDAEATGIAADLLQISPEERRRVARSAMLFSEEDLSRFLAIVLRTFDELGYRQEQRFHLELGLLKLVHVQRLVPIEELLSQLGTKPPSSTQTKTTATSAPRLSPSASGSSLTPTPPAATSSLTSSPTPASPQSAVILSEAVSQSHRETAQSKDPEVASSPKIASPFSAPTLGGPSFPATSEKTGAAITTASTSGALALASSPSAEIEPAQGRPHLVPAATAALDLLTLQAAMVAALAAIKGQSSASEQIEESAFAVNGNVLDIQTNLSKMMLPVGINADAEKVLAATLRSQNMGIIRLKLLPGVPAALGAPKKARAAASGSAAELAEKHPIVQEAKRLFSAEISNIIDLRD